MGSNPSQASQNFSPHDLANQLSQMGPEAEILAMKQFAKTYNKLSNECFTRCCHDFTAPQLNEKESSCVGMCVDKMIKISQRMMIRFQEQQSLLNEINSGSK